MPKETRTCNFFIVESNDLVLGLSKFRLKEDRVCDTCAKGKHIKSSFKSKKMISTSHLLEVGTIAHEFVWSHKGSE